MLTGISSEHVYAMIDEASDDPFFIHSDRGHDAIVRACVRFENTTASSPVCFYRIGEVGQRGELRTRVGMN